MSAPRCRNGHRPVHCQRFRLKPWANLDGRPHKTYRCPVCQKFVFVDSSFHDDRRPWWSV
jgi:hypothetical protein